MRRGARAARWPALVLTGVLLTAGCSEDPTGPDPLPAIDTALTRVDEALVAGDLAGARTALGLLEALTQNAQDDGRLDEDTADEVLAAAAALEARLVDHAASAEPPDAGARTTPVKAAPTKTAKNTAPKTTTPKKAATKQAAKKAAPTKKAPPKKTGPKRRGGPQKKGPGKARGKGRGRG